MEHEDRIRQLEIEFTSIKTKINTSMVFGTFLALAFMAFLGFTNFYTIPKEADRAAAGTVTSEVSQRLQVLAEDMSRKQALFEDQISKANSSIPELLTPVSKRLGPFQLRAICVQRTDNGCNPPSPRRCDERNSDEGWFDTGMEINGVVPGGSCGFGPICRVCGKYKPQEAVPP